MIILIRYGEIHLKGLNRPYFERLLKEAVHNAVKPFGGKVERGDGRYFVRGVPDEDFPSAMKAVSKVFGVSSLSPAYEVEKSRDGIYTEALRQAREYVSGLSGKSATFKVDTKRSDKNFPMRSMEVSADLGGYILENCPELSVDLHDPDFRIYVEIRENAYVYSRIIPGQGGMPLGSNGKATLLLSGGIDSPVAGYMIGKRGVYIDAVHFESFPYTSERAREKVINLAKIVSGYTGTIHMSIIHFTDIQLAIYEKCPEEYLTVIMRRFMMRIAERIARGNGSTALVTGESIGQVASQTMEALYCTDAVVGMPVFRPMIGMDKEEIVTRAKEIGTFDTSILPYEDCCTVFVPKHPATRPKIEKIADSEKVLEIDAMIDSALEKSLYCTVYPAAGDIKLYSLKDNL